MNWRNVKLVWRREIRDQLRDRRTLFVIGVLPLLIYPMMGIAFTRLSQFTRQNDARIAVIGSEQLAAAEGIPPLIEGDNFRRQLFHDPALVDRMHLELIDGSNEALDAANDRLSRGTVDLVIYFPPGFAERLDTLRQAVQTGDGIADPVSTVRPPKPVVYYDVTRDESQLANSRVQILLDRWKSQIARSNLEAGRLPFAVTDPFDVQGQDVSSNEGRQAALWSKLLPFIVFVCALTGAFYPAVDLCAGEKERGTLETLLTSPAQRSEIVGGKLLTVITFSIGSALCNLASMAITGQIILKQINAMGAAGGVQLSAPAFSSIAWLLIALLPMAALFSAASLALAALARSTKEGQYYLMPLFLVCMPLMMLPLLPGIELNLATSAIPISGMVLLMQAAMEGKLLLAATYLLPVTIVTLVCCVIAIRWAIDQFNQESVLFRDTENFSLPTWIRYAYRHRPDTPKLSAAVALMALLFGAQFVSQAFTFDITKPSGFVAMVLFSQLVCILLPTVLVALASIRSWTRTFLLTRSVPWKQVGVAILLAAALNPVGTRLMEVLSEVFPLPPGLLELAEKLAAIGGDWELPLVAVLLLMAVLPAICEELAFRGFVLSGLRTRMSAGWAVVFSAVLFGLAHGTALQQTVSATLLGLVLGYIAIKTSQVTPCVAFHMSYNGLQLLRTRYADSLSSGALSEWVFRPSDTPVVDLGFTTPVVVLSGLAAVVLLWQVGQQRCRLASTLGLPGGGRSHLPNAAPAEESGA